MKHFFVFALLAAFGGIEIARGQDEPAAAVDKAIGIEIAEKPAGPPTVPLPGGKATEEKAATPEAEVEPDRTPIKPLGPNFIKLSLLDGNIISGDLSIDEITVDTQFGKLIVPISKIRSLTPGLDSYPELATKISELIDSLGSEDYKTREQAHKDLAGMGGQVRHELDARAGDDNAEVKRHVAEIIKEIDEQTEEQDEMEEDAPSDAVWIRQDKVVTSDFTVVGKVSPTNFKVASKYGPLTVALADVRTGEREAGVKGALRKSMTVAGENLAQRTFKNSAIRVQAGDRVTVKAEGSLVMSPWGSNSSSTPDGGQNFGWYVPNQIPGGALVAKIGDKGPIFKVGRQSTFVAKSSGTLQFAIAMQAEYSNEGYQFPGEYRLKIKVDPK